MRRLPPKKSNKLATESLRIANLSLAVAQSASRLEDLAWQAQLDALVRKNLKLNHHELLDAAAEYVFQTHPNAYEVLIETFESISTSHKLEHQGQSYDVLLIAAPVLAWTRFDIASGGMADDVVQQLSAQLSDCLLADQARLSILPTLFALDQLPRTHSEAFTLMERTAQHLLKEIPASHPQKLPQTVPFLADVRYLIGTVVVPENMPMFKWQTIATPFDCVQAKADALNNWIEQATPTMHRLLPGCGIEMLLPEAYYTACREADIQIRPASIRSAVFYLSQTLGIEPSGLEAIIAGFGEPEHAGQLDEYRISFAIKSQPEVVYGVVWPLYQADDQITALGNPEDDNLPGEITTILLECGVLNVQKIDEMFEMEFCDDCHSPLFADRDGELVHTEMPEDAPPQGSEHFH
jgi:Protein of unknown function (DUF2863)